MEGRPGGVSWFGVGVVIRLRASGAESPACCLPPPRARPPLAGGRAASAARRVRRADCPSSSGCCVTAPAAYPPRALGSLPPPLGGGSMLQRCGFRCLLFPVSPVTNFLRLSGRVAGGAHRASEGSWSSWNSRSSWSSWRLQRWPALAPTHGRSKSPLGLTGGNQLQIGAIRVDSAIVQSLRPSVRWTPWHMVHNH